MTEISPQLVDLPSQHFVGVTGSVTMTTINEIADRIPEIAAWLAERSIAFAGAPFFRYLVIEMPDRLTIEVGFPVDAAIDGDDVVHSGTLPAGRYATVTHHGHPDGLVDVTAGLLQWASDNDVALDMTDEADCEHWACRLERYHTNPMEQPDLNQWETVVAIKLA